MTIPGANKLSNSNEKAKAAGQDVGHSQRDSFIVWFGAVFGASESVQAVFFAASGNVEAAIIVLTIGGLAVVGVATFVFMRRRK